jgi:hypothetical protein
MNPTVFPALMHHPVGLPLGKSVGRDAIVAPLQDFVR